MMYVCMYVCTYANYMVYLLDDDEVVVEQCAWHAPSLVHIQSLGKGKKRAWRRIRKGRELLSGKKYDILVHLSSLVILVRRSDFFLLLLQATSVSIEYNKTEIEICMDE